MKLYPPERLPSEPPTCFLIITDGGSTETYVLWIFSLNALGGNKSGILKLHSWWFSGYRLESKALDLK